MSTKNSSNKIILASSSVYRQELLARLNLAFTAIAPNIDESAFSHELPEQTALRLAEQKARAIATHHPDAIIIGSDQVATLDGEQIGKPGTHENALRQLQKMRGREVIFHTALCVLDHRNFSSDTSNTSNTSDTPKMQSKNCQTLVRFRDLSDAEFDAYLRIEQPYDCAGSAKNEGLGIILIESIKSDDPTALTGLPLIALTGMLRNLGVQFFSEEN
ncbi:MAG: Maf-like protein [Undibacterium sp.]|nr:Maf-like protein [Undibacterium sp.]